MIKVARIPLKSFSRFHFGELKLDHDLALSDTSLFAHSDTLFSALVNGYSRFANGADDFINLFKVNGGIRISSLFYYIENIDGENTERVYFLPKPVFLDIESPKTSDGSHKRLNRIKFVSTGVWQNGFEANRWFDEIDPAHFIVQNMFVMTKREHELMGSPTLDDIVTTVLSPKSPKRGEDGQAIYYQADVETGSNVNVIIGIYFLYEAEGQDEIELKIATNVMAYTGIGGEIKNTGRTVRSQPEFDILNMGPSETQSVYVCVSLLNPQEEELNKVIFYSSTLRGGRLLGNSKDHSKVVRMIEEGALLKSPDIKGRLIELGPDEHGRIIYRLGTSFLIPVNYGH